MFAESAQLLLLLMLLLPLAALGLLAPARVRPAPQRKLLLPDRTETDLF
jgi:hypothetical protein